MFKSNSECANALFDYLVKKNYASAAETHVKDDILHDLNNGRGHEWLEHIIKNLSTMCFFDYIPRQDYGDEFVIPYAISATTFVKRVFNDVLPTDCSYEQFLDYWHDNGFSDLWDYAEKDVDDAIENNDYLIALAFYSETGCQIRFFEITELMANCFY